MFVSEKEAESKVRGSVFSVSEGAGCVKEEKEEIRTSARNASLGASASGKERVSFSSRAGGWMSEDAAAHCHADAETQTYTSACSAHAGGPMQLQSDTEEKKVSA